MEKAPEALRQMTSLAATVLKREGAEDCLPSPLGLNSSRAAARVSADIEHAVVAAELIDHLSRALGIAAPFVVHNEEIVVSSARQFHRRRPVSIFAFPHGNGAL